MLNYTTMLEFFSNTREVYREAWGTAECFLHFSHVLKNIQGLKSQQYMRASSFFIFFFIKCQRNGMPPTRDVSHMLYNLIKAACDIRLITSVSKITNQMLTVYQTALNHYIVLCFSEDEDFQKPKKVKLKSPKVGKCLFKCKSLLLQFPVQPTSHETADGCSTFKW